MALSGSLEATVELKSPADKFYRVWKETPYDIPNHAPSHFQAVELHDSDWDSHGHGSIKTWTYVSEGKAELFKEKVAYDDANTTVNFVGLDGHPFKLYKTYNCTIKATPKETGSVAKIIIDYEKLSPEVKEPHTYLEVMVGFVKDIDASLAKA